MAVERCAQCYGNGRLPGPGYNGYFTPYNSYTCPTCRGSGRFGNANQNSAAPYDDQVTYIEGYDSDGSGVVAIVVLVLLFIGVKLGLPVIGIHLP